MRQSLTAILVSAFLLTTANGQQPVLYASQSFPQSPAGGMLFTVDQTTGLLTSFPWDPTAEGLMPAIAFDSKGNLWGSENKDNPDLFCAGGRGSGRCGHLIKINPANGSLIQRCEAFQVSEGIGMRLTDLSFEPGTDRLFGLDTSGNLFIVQDPCLGADTPGPELLVGATGLNRGGLAFRSDGRLYLTSVSGQLAEIDPTDGSVIGQVLQMANGIEGAGFRPTDDVLWGTGDDARELYTIDLSTGDQTLIVQNNGVYTTSLSFTPLRHLQFAELGNGGGLISDFSAANPSSERSVSGHIDFFGPDGAPLPIGIVDDTGDELVISTEVDPLAEVSSVQFDVAPLDSITIATDGQGDLKIGGAVVTSDGPLGGVIRFGVSVLDLGVAGVGASEPLQGFIIPVRRVAGGINTGIAMRNPGGSPVKVTLKLLSDGQEVDSQTIDSLAAGGQTQKFINEFFPGTDTDDFVGTMVVEVEGGKVAPVALEQGENPGEFTTLPVTPLG